MDDSDDALFVPVWIDDFSGWWGDFECGGEEEGNRVKTNEQFYDEEIAPELLRLCALCKERGMAFVASVEFDPLNMGRGRTEFQPVDTAETLSAAQRLVHWAARANGNIDSLMIAVDRHAREHGHSSIYLSLAGNKNVKYSGSETAALMVTSPS